MQYYRMPYICQDNNCFYCNQKLTETAKTDFMIFHTSTYQSKSVNYAVFYCRKCDLFQMDKNMFSEIKKENKYWSVSLINKSPNLSLDFIKELMMSPLDFKLHKGRSNLPPKIFSNDKSTLKKTRHWVWCKDLPSFQIEKKPKLFLNKYEIVSSDLWKDLERLYSYNSNDYAILKRCPLCKKLLFPAYTLVPINLKDYAKIEGRQCFSCNCIYVKDCEELKKLFIDNKSAKSYTLNGRCYANYSEDEKRKKEERKLQEERQASINRYLDLQKKYPSIIFLIMLVNEEQKAEYVIVEKKEEENIENNILYFKNEIARELLAAVNIDDKKKIAYINNKPYSILLLIQEKKNLEYLPPYITLIDDDKYHNYHIKNDVLLYSPFTQKYEIAKIAIKDNMNYWGISAFRKFVCIYGKPDIDIDIDTSSRKNHGKINLDELRAKSILKIFGYSVNQQDNLSSKERQKILSDVVDLEIMSVEAVIYMLNFFIQMHTNGSYYFARNKWKEDLEFIQNYTVDPDRFLVIGNKK